MLAAGPKPPAKPTPAPTPAPANNLNKPSNSQTTNDILKALAIAALLKGLSPQQPSPKPTYTPPPPSRSPSVAPANSLLNINSILKTGGALPGLPHNTNLGNPSLWNYYANNQAPMSTIGYGMAPDDPG
jgi:hypothetical protein